PTARGRGRALQRGAARAIAPAASPPDRAAPPPRTARPAPASAAARAGWGERGALPPYARERPGRRAGRVDEIARRRVSRVPFRHSRWSSADSHERWTAGARATAAAAARPRAPAGGTPPC